MLTLARQLVLDFSGSEFMYIWFAMCIDEYLWDTAKALEYCIKMAKDTNVKEALIGQP